MTDARAKDWIEIGDRAFGKRGTLISYWQESAYNFYPERADFTTERTIGETFAENLMTSYPLVARRELGNAFSSMLRPTQKEWFKMTIAREDKLDLGGRRWLAYATKVQRRAMYPRATKFTRATKEADHDFAAFGQAVISHGLNNNRDDLLYRCWHLRDVVWFETAEGDICQVHRKWKPYVRDVMKLFPKTADRPAGSKLKQLAEKDPFCEIEVRHIVMEVDDYEPPAGKRRPRQKYVSIFIDMIDNEVLEEVGSRTLQYVIPRWQTVSGSQYAYSPATVAALPDARLMQAMTLSLLEAGEKMANPPMLATQEAIRSDLQLYAGGVTWTDADYDERTGEAMRALRVDTGGMPVGRDMRNDVKEMLSQCFYLNKLNMPDMSRQPEMTAFEVGQRMQEYIRQALPLFEPMEVDYNGGLCEATFDDLLHNGAFGPWSDIPQSIRGSDVQFEFSSPLTDLIEAQLGQKFASAGQLIAQAVELDPSCAQMVDAKTALRETLLGVGIPPVWINTPQQIQAISDQANKAAQISTTLDGMQKGANVAKTLSDAGVPIGEIAGQALGGQQQRGPLPPAPV